MDPLSIVSAVSAIVQIVDFSARLISKSFDLYRDGTDNSVGAPVFEAAAADLRLLSTEMQRKSKPIEDATILELCTQCDQVTQQLLGALRSIVVGSKQKIWASIRKALKSIWSKAEIEALEKQLSTIRMQLNLRISVDVRDKVAECDERIQNLDGTAQQIYKAILAQKDVFAVQMTTDLAILTVLRRQEHYAESADQEKDLAKLPYVPQAAFNTIERQHDALCLQDTRVDLLQAIEKWIAGADGRHIFWLSGLAGTGKSTISSTVARRHGHFTASFCFSRGGGDLGHARKLFTSLALQLAERSPILRRYICDAIKECNNIPSLSLYDQWRYLVLTPLSRLGKEFRGLTLLIVIDALDECDDERDIRAIISLLSEARSISTCQIRIFLTSRPDNPIRYGFHDIKASDHTDCILHDISRTVVDADIERFLHYHFSEIGKERLLPPDWPGEAVIAELVRKSSGLFIWADTVCRFVREGRRFAKKRLDTVLKGSASSSVPEQTLDNIYLTVLDSSIPKSYDEEEREETCALLREVLGSLIVLTSPHTISSLAALLRLPKDEIEQGLEDLHAIIDIPPQTNPTRSIRLHHPSLRDFLLDHKRCTDARFWIDSTAAHLHLLRCSIELMSESLAKDMLGLDQPGISNKDVESTVVRDRLPLELQYACSSWVHHLRVSGIANADDDFVHEFLKEHLLHWFEALSLMGKMNEGVMAVIDLETHLKSQSCPALTTFVHDAKRFALDNRWIMETAPLQIYTSSLTFAPSSSLVRQTFAHYRPSFIRNPPKTFPTWGPTLLTLEGHTNWVRSVAFSPDGRIVASGSADKTIKLWDTGFGSALQTLEGHSDWVYSVAFAASGNMLASGSVDKTVRVWDYTTGAVLRILEGHTQGVRGVAFGSVQSSLLASGGCDKSVRVWDLQTGKTLHVLNAHSEWVYDVALSENDILVSGSADRTVAVWQARTGTLLQTITGYSSSIRSVSISSDGSKIASVSSDQSVWLAELPPDATRKTTPQELHGHSDWVYGCALSPDGKRIASVAADRCVKLWDVSTRAEIETLRGHNDWIYAVAFSPDGESLASGGADSTIRIWDVSRHQPHIAPEHRGPVHSVAVSPDGEMMASAAHDDLSIKVWRTAGTSAVLEFRGHEAWIHRMRFSPDGRWLASCADDGTVRVWEVESGREVAVLRGHERGVRAVEWSPSGDALASAADDRTVRVWDLSVVLGAVSPEEDHHDSKGILATTGAIAHDRSATRAILSSAVLKGHAELVQTVTWSEDGSKLASGGDDACVIVWERSPPPAQSQSTGYANVTASSPAAPCPTPSFGAEETKTTTESGSGLYSFQKLSTFRAHRITVRAVAFSPPSGALLASTSPDGEVKIWNTASPALLQSIPLQTYLNALSFAHRGCYLRTNRGVVPLSPSVYAPPVTNAPHGRAPSTRMFLEGHWITRGGKKVLWLPPVYRAQALWFQDNRFFLGHSSGCVSWMEFEREGGETREDS